MNLSDFLKKKSRLDVRGLEVGIINQLKRMAGISGKEREGEFSFICPGEGEKERTYDIFVECFETPEGEAVALTVATDEADVLPDAVLYRSQD